MSIDNTMQDDQSLSINGLHAIVIGAGFGGLSSAIDLARLGATVQVLESSKNLSRQGEISKPPTKMRKKVSFIHVSISGDVIRFEANASRVMQPWGNVLDEAVRAASPLDNLTIIDK